MLIKNIPLEIYKRLVDISSNEQVFNEAAEYYQAQLNKCGYNHQLVWSEKTGSKAKRKRKREVVWFNPPFSMNVQTRVGKEFLSLIDKHFPKGSPLSKFVNRNTIKVSYKCALNMGTYLTRHNAKTLKIESGVNNPPPPRCNCPLRGP